MDRRNDRKILREQEALAAGYLLTPMGQLLKVTWAKDSDGTRIGYFEEVSEEDFGVLYVVGCG